MGIRRIYSHLIARNVLVPDRIPGNDGKDKVFRSSSTAPDGRATDDLPFFFLLDLVESPFIVVGTE